MKSHYSPADIKKVKWGVLEENKPIHLYPVMHPGWCGVIKGTGKYLGKYQKNIACLFSGDSEIIFVDHREWTDLGRFALKKIIRNTNWGLRLNNRIIKQADSLTNFSHYEIFKANLKKLTNQQLFLLYKKYLFRQSQVYNPSLIPVYLDMYKPHLTKYLVEYLDSRRQSVKSALTAKECFAKLTIPKKLSKVQLEEISLLKIAAGIRRKKLTKKGLKRKILKKFNAHCDKYGYLGYNWEGPAFPDRYFWKRLIEFVADRVRPEDKIKKIIQENEYAQADHEKLIKVLKVDRRHQQLLEIARGFIYSKDYRKMSLVQSYYEVEPLLKEIGRRAGLRIAEVRSCLLDEVGAMLQGRLARPADLPKRMRGCLFIIINRRLPGKVLVGRHYSTFKKHLMKKEDLTEVSYFHGQTACLGKAEGVVKIINSVKDLPKMRKSDIMVSQMTNPDLVPAMKKAAAVVTDSGGVTCHAAIISRELKIPCVIGTKVATKVLKDGDKVAVDANRGDIRRI